MNMIDLGYVVAAALIAMIIVVRAYPLVQPRIQRWRAESKFSVGRAASAITQGSSV